MSAERENAVWNRNQTIAILLAVIFGPGTWLYTYRRDAGKAALGLGWEISSKIIFASDWVRRTLYPQSGFDDSIAYLALGMAQATFVTWLVAVVSSSAAREWRISGPEKRDKTVAVLAAILLGPWTWLYTYKKDKGKFWPAVLFDLSGIVARSLLPEAQARLIQSIWFPIFVVIWVAALMLALLRKNEWYRSYGGLSVSKSGSGEAIASSD